MKKERNALYKFLKNPENLISTIFGIVITAATMLFKSIKIPMWILGIVLIISIIIIWYLIHKIIITNDESKSIIPICWYKHIEHGNVLITDNYEFLSDSTYVTIYLNNEVNEYFATGFILHEKTSKGRLMIKILKYNESCLGSLSNLKLPKPDDLIIKPIVTDYYIKEIIL